MSSFNIPDSNLPRIVIIGGGFAGLTLAKKIDPKRYQVVVLDKHNYHTFQPLLYQVATAGLEPDSIAYPLRKIFQEIEGLHFRLAEVKHIDPSKKIISSEIGELHFDYLVIATGSKTNYFGNQKIESLSIPMKSLPEALNLRSLILQNFEASILTSDLKERERLMNYVIVGGGPTGVELAGALAELKSHVLPADYPDLDLRRMTIHLVEASPRLLNGMSDKAGKTAHKYLQKLGVNVWLNTAVQDYDGSSVTTAEKKLPASTLIWAAGVTGAIIEGISTEYQKGGRFSVDATNQIIGLEGIYAIGDVAVMMDEKHPKGHPMVAPVAIQQAENLANNLHRISNGIALIPFQYKNKGSMATVGRNKAVVDLGKLKFKGFSAWMVWMFVHLMSLVGFRNRVIALINWSLSYLSYDRGIRLIVRPYKKK